MVDQSKPNPAPAPDNQNKQPTGDTTSRILAAAEADYQAVLEETQQPVETASMPSEVPLPCATGKGLGEGVHAYKPGDRFSDSTRAMKILVHDGDDYKVYIVDLDKVNAETRTMTESEILASFKPSNQSDSPPHCDGEGPGEGITFAPTPPTYAELLGDINKLIDENINLQVQAETANRLQEIWRQTVVDAITNGISSPSPESISLPGTAMTRIYDLSKPGDLMDYNSQLNEIRRHGWPIHNELALGAVIQDGQIATPLKLTWIVTPDTAELPESEMSGTGTIPEGIACTPDPARKLIQSVHDVPPIPIADLVAQAIRQTNLEAS